MRRSVANMLLGFSLAAIVAAAPAEACTASASGVAFGTYSPQSPVPLDGAGSVTVSCHPNTSAPTVAISAGNSGSFAARRMTVAGDHLSYNLFISAARVAIWGDGTGGSTTVTLSGGLVSGGNRTFSASVFGRIPAGQHVRAGSYGDTLFVTVIF